MARVMRLSNSPAAPTNGSPCRSSSAPGPSPTNISSAAGLPEPNTPFARPSLSRQRAQPAAAAATAPTSAPRPPAPPLRGVPRGAMGPAASPPSTPGEASRFCGQLDGGGRPRCLLVLAWGDRPRRQVGPRRCHDDEVGGRGVLPDGPLHLAGGDHVDALNARG